MKEMLKDNRKAFQGVPLIFTVAPPWWVDDFFPIMSAPLDKVMIFCDGGIISDVDSPLGDKDFVEICE